MSTVRRGILENSMFFFWVLANSKKTLGFLEILVENLKKLCVFFKRISCEIPKKRRVFVRFLDKVPKKHIEFSKIPKIFGEIDTFFWILVNSIFFWILVLVENLKTPYVFLNLKWNPICLFIFHFHLLIYSIHILNCSSYLRTTFIYLPIVYVFSIHLSTYFCTHFVLLID